MSLLDRNQRGQSDIVFYFIRWTNIYEIRSHSGTAGNGRILPINLQFKY
jgi:hypothetical protein